MALEINKTENVFFLKGRLHANQVFQIRSFFEAKLKTEEEVTISLIGLEDIDLSGAMMFKQLKDHAFRTNKSLMVYAGVNKKILGPFSVLEDQYVLAA